jgi:MFS family permease
MRLRQTIPTSQLIDDSGVLARPGWLLAGLCLAGAAKAIEPSFEVFYPPTAAPFGAGWSLARFLSSSWAVILVLFMLGGGILGDLYGRRRVLLWGLMIMLSADVLLLLSPNSLWHVFWRIPANISAGIVLPLALAPLYIFFEGRQRAISFAIYLTITTLAGLLSGYLGRFITQSLDWRNVYLIPGLITIVAFILVRRSLPESRVNNPRLIDTILYASWTILVLGFIYAVFELSLGSEWLIVVLVIVGLVAAVGLGLIVWWRRQTRGDVLRSRSIHTRHVIVMILCGAILQITLLGSYSLTYRFYRMAQNKDFTQTLLSMSPMFLGMLATIFLIARLWAHQEVRRFLAVGFFVLSIAIACIAFVARLPYWLQILPLVVFGISIMSTRTVWTNAFFQILIDRYIGLNAGINSATLLVGGALGGVITTELLSYFGQSAFVHQYDSISLSERALESLYQDISATISLGEQAGIRNLALTIGSGLYTQYQAAYIVGYSLAILVIAILCLLAALLIFLGIRATLRFKPEDTPLDDDAADESLLFEDGGIVQLPQD